MNNCIENKVPIQKLNISQISLPQKAKVHQQHIKQNIVTNQVQKIEIQGGYSPYIGSNGNWFEYDNEKKEFVDTKVFAGGTSGGFNYETAVNKPKINKVELEGNKNSQEIKIIGIADFISNEEIYNIINI